MKAVLLVSHGSRSPQTKQEVESLLEVLKSKSDISIFEYAFLELETPDIPEGISSCVRQKATDIRVLLNFLNSGRHVNEDIPAIVEECRKEFPGVKITISKPVGQHPAVSYLFLDMIE